MSIAIKTCANCGQVNPAVHDFCPSCGATLGAIERHMAPWTFADRFPPQAEAVRPDRRRTRRRPPETSGVGLAWIGFVLVAIPIMISTRSTITDLSWGGGIAVILVAYWQLRRDPGALARAGVITNGFAVLVLGIIGAKILTTGSDPSGDAASIAAAITPTSTPDWEGSPTPSPSNNSVAMYLANPAHTGEMPGPGIDGRPKQVWRFDSGGELYSSPAVVDGLLYVGTKSGFVYALDATTGAARWRQDLGNYIVRSSPAVVDGQVFVGSGTTLHALEAKSGKSTWTGSTSFSGSSSAAVADGVVYVASQSSVVYAFDAETGKQKWAFPTDGPVFSAPTVVGETVLFGADNGKLIALNAANGQLKWRFEADGGIFSSPAVAADTVFTTTRGGKTYAVSLKDGRGLWSYDAGGDASPVISGGIVYIGDQNGGVYAFDAARGGQPLWLKPTESAITVTPTIADGVLYVVSGSTLYALDARTSDEIWRYAAGYRIATSPVVVNGYVYIGGQDGFLDAITGDGSAQQASPTQAP